jgi:ABC-2 type transport system permease protein
MLDLIRKDLILNKKFLLIFGLLYLVYLSYLGSRVGHPRELVVIGTLMCGLLPLIQYTREDKFKASIVNCSLPVTRREIVLSRYVLSWALTVGLYVAFNIVITVLPIRKAAPGALFDVNTILFALSFMTIYLGLLLPLILRFGMVGMFSFLIGLQVFAVTSLLLDRFKVAHFRITAQAAWVKKGLFSLRASLGAAAYDSLLIALMILLTLASFSFAVFLYKRKDL